MAEPHDNEAMEARLRDYLATELRRAEDDYPRLEAVSGRPRIRSRRPIGVALAGVALVVLAGVLVLPRVVGPGIGGPAAITMGDDGLPLRIDGEPVRRLDDLASYPTNSDYLVGGTLVLDTGACPHHSPICYEWGLVAGTTTGTAVDAMLDGASTAPGFVATSGALTVIRVGKPSEIDGVLNVTSIAWRQPTKGPIPDNATPPEGGMENEALVPDFVPTWDRDGVTIAGYIPKRYLIGTVATGPGTPSNPPHAEPIPVYGEDLVTLVGHSVPGVGFVPLGATETPSPFDVSAAPATEAPETEAPVMVVPSGSPGAATIAPEALGAALDCGRIDPVACARAADLARAVDFARPEGEVETRNATRIVVEDTCPPGSMCDRKYPFDSYVVFVTAGADTTGWIAFEATGLRDQPTAASRLMGTLPSFMADRVAASTASVAVFRFDVTSRASKPVVVTAGTDAGETRIGFRPGDRGSIYVELPTPSSIVSIQFFEHPACAYFSGGMYTLGYGEMLLVDDDPAGPSGLTLAFDRGMFAAPQPLPVNDLRCPGG